MNKVTLVLELEFEDKINNQEEINEIAINVLDGILFQVDSKGVAPEENLTNSVKITKDGKLIVCHDFRGLSDRFLD